MAHKCGECVKMQTSGDCRWGNEYYCEKDCKYYPINKDACSSFIQKPDKGYHRAGIPWYITSIICERLGLGAESEMLKTTYTLKELYFAKHNQEFLSEYDEIGPQISINLMTEPIEYIESLYNRFLIPCHEDIKFGLLKPAADIYQNMVNELKARYLTPDETPSLQAQLLRIIPEPAL